MNTCDITWIAVLGGNDERSLYVKSSKRVNCLLVKNITTSIVLGYTTSDQLQTDIADASQQFSIEGTVSCYFYPHGIQHFSTSQFCALWCLSRLYSLYSHSPPIFLPRGIVERERVGTTTYSLSPPKN